ncbi:hypothetical protein OG233_15360 [Streptomyces sp. NBC_01218]|uniref:hypothetical protein n=1 Tax=unclassified Streptomyces TaxID=2593676 RepID=UPI002E0FD327|nr:hypothetical protein OG233_15360 [Streptomyces sp. NBC_01218]
MRPGRPLTPQELASAVAALEEAGTEGSLTPAPSPEVPFPSSEPGPARRLTLSARSAERVRQVSLGGGIALVGLGVGFVAARMRRVE